MDHTTPQDDPSGQTLDIDGDPAGPTAVDGLVGLLDLEQLEDNLYRGIARGVIGPGIRRPGRRPGADRRRPHGTQ